MRCLSTRVEVAFLGIMTLMLGCQRFNVYPVEKERLAMATSNAVRTRSEQCALNMPK